MTPEASPPPQDTRNWSMLAHLSALVVVVGVPSFVGPLVVWLIRRDSDPVSAEHAREALNFNLSVLIYGLVLGVVMVVLGLLTFGVALFVLVPLLLVLVVLWLVVTIVAAVRASNGEAYHYPLTIPLVS